MKIHALWISVFLLACGDEELITNNVAGNNSTNNPTNNSTTTNNNTIIGTACESSDDCTPLDPICQDTVMVRMTGNGLCGSETGICNYFRVTERVDCSVTVQTCENGACVDNPCTNTVCDTPANHCEGQTLFFYPSASRCELPGGTCVNNQASVDCAAMDAECIVDQCVGACVGVTCNAPPSPTCDNTTAKTYAGGTCNPDTGSCAYTETLTDCAATEQTCRNGVCVTDRCAGVTCDMPPAAACDEAVAVTHGAGVCAPADGTCSYPEVRTDCTANGGLCMNGACSTDLCANVVCNTPPAASCDEAVAVTHGAGVCKPADGTCGYTETRTDCAASGRACKNGACVSIVPAVGNLIITEVMHSPLAVTDELGEWFEIKNVSTRNLNINGIIIGSGGDTDFTVQLGGPVMLAPQASYVFGNNDDLATNNNVAVGGVYTGIVLDAADSLTLKVGTVTITTLAWDTAADWPTTVGASMNFGAQHPASSNATAANWCDSTTALGTDFGTPGVANIDCP